jgi:hypothetical protein
MSYAPNTNHTRPLLRAAARDGILLPVIDVTDPRFAVADDAESRRQLLHQASEEEQRNRRLPKFVMRFLLRRAARRSLLLRALFSGDATFLDGITTYVMKLGADNLPPPYDSPTDKRVAASAHLTLLRLRTQQVAHLIAGGLAPHLADTGAAPLALLNIAGGPAIDSLNALILLRQRNANLLRRPIAVHVLDQDEAGPFFGRNALGALMQEGAPLAGLDITFCHHLYDWNDPAALASVLRELGTAAVIAASSEGGLFEYGSDGAIVDNLTALHAGGVPVVAGSVTTNDDRRRRTVTASRFKLIPRGLEGFAPLAARAAYRIARAETAQLSDQVLLTPA